MDDKELHGALFAHIRLCQFDGNYCPYYDVDVDVCRECIKDVITIWKERLDYLNRKGDR